MKEEHKALVHYRLGEAKETLEEARLLARESRWRGALKRLGISSPKQSDSVSSFWLYEARR